MTAAVAVNTLLSKDGYFDLRAIGLIHGALFLLAFYLLSTLLDDAPRTLRLATYGAVLFCFTDVMYVSYLNSFYMDVAAWLFLFIAAMFYLRWLRWGRRADGLCFVVCCAMAVTSKAQHAILGFWLAPLLLAGGHPLSKHRKKWMMAAAASIALLAVVWIGKSAPSDYAPRGVFTMAFYRILPHSKNVEQTISALGMDESYRRYIGMHSFAQGSPMEDAAFVERFRSRISYGGLLWFYLTHPRDAYTALRLSLDEAGVQRPNLGNFDVHTGYPRFRTSRAFSFWSDLKKLGVRHERIALFLYLSRSGGSRRDVACDAAPQPGPGRRGGWGGADRDGVHRDVRGVAGGCGGCSSPSSAVLRFVRHVGGLDGLPERPRVVGEGTHQLIYQPPFTCSVWPVM